MCIIINHFKQFSQLILGRIVKKCCQQMSDFKAKMHQNRFRLRVSPRPCLQPFPDTLAAFKGILRDWEGWEGKRRMGGKGGEREGDPVCIFKFSLE